MVDFLLTEEQLALKKLAHDFGEKEIKPVAMELDAKPDPADCNSWELIRKMAKVGFRTLCVPAKYGGGGVDDCLTSCIIAEELSVFDTGIATAVFMSPLKLTHLLEGGTEEQRKKYLTQYCQDDEFLMSDSITEPESGVDDILPYDAPGAGLMTSVQKDGDYYIINGRKRFINNAYTTKLDLAWTRTDPNAGVSKGSTVFIIPTSTPGWSAGRVDDKLGGRLTCNGEIFYDNVRVHKSQILGDWNNGHKIFIYMLDHGDNLVNAARMVGVGRAVYEDSVAYAKERVQGGKPIIQHQCVQMDLADIFMEVEAARAFLWYAVWRLDNRDTVPFDIKYGTMASTLCHEMALKVAVRALPMWGGSGIQKEVSIQKYLRDAASFLHADGGVHVKRIWTAQAM